MKEMATTIPMKQKPKQKPYKGVITNYIIEFESYSYWLLSNVDVYI